MAITYGVTSLGFVIKTLEVILEEIREDYRTLAGDIPLTEDTIEGQFIAIMADREAAVWQEMQAVFNSKDADNAVGEQLDSLCALTGTTRKVALQSLATLTATGTATSVVTTGSQASVAATSERFETLADGTLIPTALWVLYTAYVVGDRVTNGGNVYVCTVAGTSANSGGPTTEVSAIADGTVTWRFVGNGTADVDIAAASVNTGEIAGFSGTINTIETTI